MKIYVLVFISKQWCPKPASQKSSACMRGGLSIHHTLWFCIHQLQVDILAEQSIRGVEQSRCWPCCHMQSLSAETKQVSFVYQFWKRNEMSQAITEKPRSSSHSISWQWVFSNHWFHGGSVSLFAIPRSRKSISPFWKMEFLQKYFGFLITQYLNLLWKLAPM